MTCGSYTGPGWYRIADHGQGKPGGSTRVVWIGPKRDPWYGVDWIAIWLTGDDRSAVMMEGRQATFNSTIVGRISADAT